MASRALLFGLLLPVSGCITTPASQTGWSAKARNTRPVPCGDEALIEDLEDGDTQALKRDGRGGYWYSMLDSNGSKMTPQQFEAGSPGRAGSKHSAHMQGQLAPAAPGVYPYAGLGFGLAEHGTYDASKYQGVSFWAKGPGKVRFEVPDGYTSHKGGWCSDCYNDFGIEIGLTEQWEQYTVLFDWLLQKPNWGDRRPTITAKELVAFEWEFNSKDRPFDIYIDDVAFICGVQGGEP
jgi:endoglucanase